MTTSLEPLLPRSLLLANSIDRNNKIIVKHKVFGHLREVLLFMQIFCTECLIFSICKWTQSLWHANIWNSISNFTQLPRVVLSMGRLLIVPAQKHANYTSITWEHTALLYKQDKLKILFEVCSHSLSLQWEYLPARDKRFCCWKIFVTLKVYLFCGYNEN